MRFDLSARVASRSIVLAQDYAAAIAVGTMNSAIWIKRPTESGQGGWDSETRTYTQRAQADIYQGIAGLSRASGSSEFNLGDESTYYSSVTIQIPYDSPHPRIDDVARVTYSPDDAIWNRFFRITDVHVGGRIASSITMSAIGIAPSRQWS